MSVRTLHAELNAVRALVADGLAEVRDTAADPAQFWIRSACVRLTAVDAALVEAAGTAAAPVRVAAGTLLTFGAVALAAALAQLAGLGPLATLGLIAVVAVALAMIVPRLAGRFRRALGRRRLARAGTAPTAFTPGAVPPHTGLIVVPESLERARVRLVSAALRQAGAGRWTTPRLRRAARSGPVRGLAHADLLLCQGIDCLERYLDDLAKGWP